MARLNPPVNEKDHIKGSLKAPVILVEYGDLQCPYCRAAFPIVNKLEKTYEGKMAFVFRHFPLAESHPFAQAAAVATEAAALQGKFWEMHELIYKNQPSLSIEMLIDTAESLKLDMKTFNKNFSDPKLMEKVEASFESGILSGVNGTPSFYINGVKYNGDYDFPSLSKAIEKASADHPVIH